MNNLKEHAYDKIHDDVVEGVMKRVMGQNCGLGDKHICKDVGEQVWDRLTVMIREQGFMHVRSRILLNE